MDIKKLRELLGWCIALNFGILMFSGFMFMIAHDWMYEFHKNLFTLSISKEAFDLMMFTILTSYKGVVFIFNVIPYFAIRIVYRNE